MVTARQMPRASFENREERQVFRPSDQPFPGKVSQAQYYQWSTAEWRRLGNYILALEEHIAGLEARIAALEA
jgi:hypothetical protein